MGHDALEMAHDTLEIGHDTLEIAHEKIYGGHSFGKTVLTHYPKEYFIGIGIG